MGFLDSYGQLLPDRADINARNIRLDGGRVIATRRSVAEKAV